VPAAGGDPSQDGGGLTRQDETHEECILGEDEQADQRVHRDGVDGQRGVDEAAHHATVSHTAWKKLSYLTLVSDHHARTVVWGKAGRDTNALDAFFDDLGPDRSGTDVSESPSFLERGRLRL